MSAPPRAPWGNRGIHATAPQPRPGALARLSAWACPTCPEPWWQLALGFVSFVAIVLALLFLPLVLP